MRRALLVVICLFVLVTAVACQPLTRTPNVPAAVPAPANPIAGTWKFLGFAALSNGGTPVPLGPMLEDANQALATDTDIQYEFTPGGIVNFRSKDSATGKTISATGTYTLTQDANKLELNITPDAMGDTLAPEPGQATRRIQPIFTGDTLILRYFVGPGAYADFKLVRLK